MVVSSCERESMHGFFTVCENDCFHPVCVRESMITFSEDAYMCRVQFRLQYLMQHAGFIKLLMHFTMTRILVLTLTMCVL